MRACTVTFCCPRPEGHAKKARGGAILAKRGCCLSDPPHGAHQLQGHRVCDVGDPIPVSNTSYYSSSQPSLSFFLHLLFILPSYEALNVPLAPAQVAEAENLQAWGLSLAAPRARAEAPHPGTQEEALLGLDLRSKEQLLGSARIPLQPPTPLHHHHQGLQQAWVHPRISKGSANSRQVTVRMFLSQLLLRNRYMGKVRE